MTAGACRRRGARRYARRSVLRRGTADGDSPQRLALSTASASAQILDVRKAGAERHPFKAPFRLGYDAENAQDVRVDIGMVDSGRTD